MKFFNFLIITSHFVFVHYSMSQSYVSGQNIKNYSCVQCEFIFTDSTFSYKYFQEHIGGDEGFGTFKEENDTIWLFFDDPKEYSVVDSISLDTIKIKPKINGHYQFMLPPKALVKEGNRLIVLGGSLEPMANYCLRPKKNGNFKKIKYVDNNNLILKPIKK